MKEIVPADCRSAPAFAPDALVTEDAILAAVISAQYTSTGSYFPVFAPPWGGPRHDETPFQQIANGIARTRPQRIIHAGIDGLLLSRLRERLAPLPVVEWANPSQLEDPLRWGPTNLGLGVLAAKAASRPLLIDESYSPNLAHPPGDSDLLVVCEKGDELCSVIVGNYAFSVGAELVMAEEWSRWEVQDLDDRLMRDENLANPARAVADFVSNRAPQIDVEKYKYVTFFGNGIPWGLLFPQRPATHMSIHPRLGAQLANAIELEQPNRRGTAVALLVDPGTVASSETTAVRDFLSDRSVYVKTLAAPEATASQIDLHLTHFPYDFLLIASHAGEIPGTRLTYELEDNRGRTREVVVERAHTFKVTPGSDLVGVGHFESFVSVDGVAPADVGSEERDQIGEIFQLYRSLRSLDGEDHPSLRLVSQEKVPAVRFAMAISTVDFPYFVTSHQLGGGSVPVVLNNTCNSWNVMAGAFLAAGARAYVGTVRPVIGAEARDVALNLLDASEEDTICGALWEAQERVYGDEPRRPYVCFGPHFVTLSRGIRNGYQLAIARLRSGVEVWERRLAADPENHGIKEVLAFHTSALKDLLRDVRDHEGTQS